MPIYEYKCKACDAKFEQLVRSMSTPPSSEPSVKCPSCGSAKTARELSVFAVGAEAGPKSSSSPAAGGCGRCGGPGPCPSGF